MEWLWSILVVAVVLVPFLLLVPLLRSAKRNKGIEHGGGFDKAPNEIIGGP